MTTRLPRVEVTSPFWRRYRDLVRESVLPYQWDVISDAIAVRMPSDPGGNTNEVPRSGAVQNLRIAAGQASGEFTGFLFQDSDVYKWLEAVAYSLMERDDAVLRAHADEMVELISQAQQDDGYLDSYFQIKEPKRRFRRLSQSHELYVMGHYIEAGVAYWEATGSELALDVARRMADCIDANFGPGQGKIHGGDGHPEIEIALTRLYAVTDERRYLDLAHWFVVVRGQDRDFYRRQDEADGGEGFFGGLQYLMRSGTYLQADKPFLEQTELNGHAVRALYLLAGAADVARLTGDERVRETVGRLWDDVTRRRMYVTGQVGSTQVGESFTYDYDLPNGTVYGETCASVALAFVARRMLQASARGEYGDVLERELFNGAIAGMSLDGRHFFYVNPLEADPLASRRDPGRQHVLTRRAEWFGCACCPANLARLVSSVDRYIYTELDGGSTVLLHQFISSRAEFASGFTVSQESDYPWEGSVSISAENHGETDVRLGVRIPAWARTGFSLRVGGAETAAAVEDGFTYVSVPAGAGVELSLELPLEPRLVRASNRVADDAGRVAVTRGPLVFCLEEADNPGPLWNYEVAPDGLSAEFRPELLGGLEVVRARGLRAEQDGEGSLYLPAGGVTWKDADMTFIPYYAWANRTEGQMRVWVRPTDPLVS